MKKSIAALWVTTLSLVFVFFMMIAEAKAQTHDRGLSPGGLLPKVVSSPQWARAPKIFSSPQVARKRIPSSWVLLEERLKAEHKLATSA